MRRILVWLLLVPVVALQMGNRWLVYVVWKANQDYIARELCENRDAPELNCEGRCCLKAEMRKTEEQESKAPRFAIPEFAPATMPERISFSVASFDPISAATRQAFPRIEGGRLAQYAVHVWQPPEA